MPLTVKHLSFLLFGLKSLDIGSLFYCGMLWCPELESDRHIDLKIGWHLEIAGGGMGWRLAGMVPMVVIGSESTEYCMQVAQVVLVDHDLASTEVLHSLSLHSKTCTIIASSSSHFPLSPPPFFPPSFHLFLCLYGVCRVLTHVSEGACTMYAYTFLCFEAGYLTEPRVHRSGHDGWLRSSRDLYVSVNHQNWGYRCVPLHMAFTWLLKFWIQVLMLVWQALY